VFCVDCSLIRINRAEMGIAILQFVLSAPVIVIAGTFLERVLKIEIVGLQGQFGVVLMLVFPKN